MIKEPFQWQVAMAELDPARGSEQAGRRPVLIVSNEPINQALPIVTVFPLTTHKKGRRIYSTEALIPARAAGQPRTSVVMAHQVRTISKDRLYRTCGWLNDEDLRDQIRSAMRTHLDLA